MRNPLDFKHPQMSFILSKVQQLTQLNQILKSVLEPQMQPYCCVANFDMGCLVVQVANAQWSTRLRYSQMELLEKLRKNGLPEVRQLKFIVEAG